jgi:ATP-dependent 26S proteasome regulatory subunit
VFFDEIDATAVRALMTVQAGDNEVQRTMLEIDRQPADGFDARGNIKATANNRPDTRWTLVLPEAGTLTESVEFGTAGSRIAHGDFKIHTKCAPPVIWHSD